MRGIKIVEARQSRRLRREQTEAEHRLWQRLRNRGLAGRKFVRQESIGPYVADFVCREARLVVEVDGATHSTDEEVRHDERRTAFIEGQGFRVLRDTNDDVYRSLDAVLDTIFAALGSPDPEARNHPAPHPNPLPAMRGEGV
jgi:very-short-patch-repair endonuclease